MDGTSSVPIEGATAEPFFALDPVQLEIGFGEPPRQSRVTVLFRWVLVVPHLVVLLFLLILAVPLLVVGWFAALILGRLPRWIARYEIGVIAYSIRVNAYWHLLARQFPAFSLSQDDYSVRVEIGASRLSRLKVLFRVVLAIPAAIVQNVVSGGLVVVSFVAWLCTLVLGRTPKPFFGAAAAVTRYQARYIAYMALVTDAYPRRLFGDPDFEWAPEGMRLSLSEGARWLMRLIVVLGVVLLFVGPVLPYELRSNPNAALRTDVARFEAASVTFLGGARSCGSGAGALHCLQPKVRAWGNAFERFASDLSGLPFSAALQPKATALAGDARALGRLLLVGSRAKTADAYTKAFSRFQGLQSRFEDDSKALFGHRL